jgi:hypothetical protein
MWTLTRDNPLTQDPYVIDTVNKLLENSTEFCRVAIKMWAELGGIQSDTCRDLLVVPIDSLAALETAMTGSADWSAYLPEIKILGIEPFATLSEEVPHVLEEVTKLRNLCVDDHVCSALLEQEFPLLYDIAKPLEKEASHFVDAVRMFSMMSVAGIGASFRDNCLVFDFLMTRFLDVFPYWTYVPSGMSKQIVSHLRRASCLRTTAVAALEDVLDRDTAEASTKAMLHEYVLLCVYELLNPATVQAMEMGVLYVNIRLVILATEKSLRQQDALIALWNSVPATKPSKKKKKAKKIKVVQVVESVGPPSVGPPSVGPPSVGPPSVGPPSVGDPEEPEPEPFSEPLLPQKHHPKFKTEVCFHYSRTGTCCYGDSCIFVHGTHRIPVYGVFS